MNDRIPNLTIEHYEDGGFLLRQDGGGSFELIELHESQLRHLAAMAGLVPAAASVYTPPTWVLARRLRMLRDRINELDERLRIVSLAGREGFEHELSYSFATWELATEFCADLAPPQATGNGCSSQTNTPAASASRGPGDASSSQLELSA